MLKIYQRETWMRAVICYTDLACVITDTLLQPIRLQIKSSKHAVHKPCEINAGRENVGVGHLISSKKPIAPPVVRTRKEKKIQGYLRWINS